MSQIVVWATLTIVFIGAAEAGYRIIRAARPGENKPQDVQAVSLMLSSTLALMTLLTAFTFNIANSRFDLRSRLVVEEANAITTTFRRQQQLTLAERARLLPLMRSYVAARRAVIADDPEELAAEELTANLQPRIWSVTLEGLNTPEGARISGPLITATNDMFDLAESRRAAIEARIPSREIAVLLAFAVGAATMIGAVLASIGSRLFLLSSAMFALFALALSLIHDIDTSGKGGIRTPISALDRAAHRIAQTELPPGGAQAIPRPSPGVRSGPLGMSAATPP